MAEESSARVAELAGALSLASDLGHDAPREHGLRVAVVTVGLGRAAGVDDATLQDAYFAALLRWAGCTATSPILASWFADDIAAHRRAQQFDGALDPLIAMLSVGAGRGLIPRLRTLASAFAAGPAAVFGAQCEAAVDLATRLGCSQGCASSLGLVFERWDGKGWPGKLRGEAIPLICRLTAIAEDADMAHHAGGIDAAQALVRRRAGRVYDPALATLFDDIAGELWAPLQEQPAWAVAMDAEPGAPATIALDELEVAAAVFADFADLKCPWFTGHSRGVAALARAGAEAMGMAEPERRLVTQAALLHDVGRVAISNEAWNRAGPLNADEREAVRLHPYHTERVMGSATALRGAGAVAALHHERLDGSGYPTARRAEALSPAARLVAAADVVQAIREPRPHRAALDDAEATALLQDEIRAGHLDAEAVAAVRGGRRAGRPPHPAGLTAREVTVLRLVARGHSNAAIGAQLFISARTVGHHIAHIYDKAAVSTRAGATLFAMRNGLIDAADEK